MHRAWVQVKSGDRVSFSEEELHHLVRVRRSTTGDLFVGLDGTGKAYLCRLEKQGSQWFGRILEESSEKNESPLHVILGQALVKKDKFEWIIQKTVELGVFEIVPLITKRSELELTSRRAEKKLHRWEKILLEAVKQCGRTQIPRLAAPTEMTEFLQEQGERFKMALDENGNVSLKRLLMEGALPSSLTVLIGPEGGWDDRDREAFERHTVCRVHLGPRILRAETAAVTILSLLQYELGDLGSE